MASRRVPFVEGEWFHCYTRGVEKRTVFETERDYARFMESLYLCNTTGSVRRDDLKRASGKHIFEYPRVETLVDIGAYCLMPNHFHILLRSKIEGGITRFMQKLGTSYTMYFNVKNERVGGLFVTPFRAKHVSYDDYFRHVAQYIHLNPIELFEPSWKSGAITASLAVIARRLEKYPYASLPDYIKGKKGKGRPEKTILDPEAQEFIRAGMPPLRSVLQAAALYYVNIAKR